MATITQPEQVGGDHYQAPVQHWDWAQYIGYLEGCATKYFGRHADKKGMVDIEKGLSFVDKICRKCYGCQLKWEFVYPIEVEPNEFIDELAAEYEVNPDRDQTVTGALR